MQDPVLGLAIGVLAGGVLQLVAQWIPLTRMGMPCRRPKTLRHPGAIKIGKLLIPRMLGGGVYQLSILIDTFLRFPFIDRRAGRDLRHLLREPYYPGSHGYFRRGDGLGGLAHALRIVSSQRRRFPQADDHIFAGKYLFRDVSEHGHPGLAFGAHHPDLFERGEFGSYSTMITSSALSCYALGLFSFGGIKILVAAFYALQDTRTPALVAAFCLTINATLNFILMYPLKVSGIALASAIAGTVDFLILFYVLEKRLGGFDTDLFRYFFKVFTAAVMTGVTVFWLWQYLTFIHEILRLVIIGVAGICLYEAICLAFRVEQARKIWDWIFNKR